MGQDVDRRLRLADRASTPGSIELRPVGWPLLARVGPMVMTLVGDGGGGDQKGHQCAREAETSSTHGAVLSAMANSPHREDYAETTANGFTSVAHRTRSMVRLTELERELAGVETDLRIEHR